MCKGKQVVLKNEDEVEMIMKSQTGIFDLHEFPEQSVFSNYITQFINIDNSLEQLRTLYKLNVPIK